MRLYCTASFASSYAGQDTDGASPQPGEHLGLGGIGKMATNNKPKSQLVALGIVLTIAGIFAPPQITRAMPYT